MQLISLIDYNKMAEYIVSLHGVSSYCGFIIITAIVIFIFGFRRRVRPIIKNMNNGLHIIKNLEGNDGFYTSFKETDSALMKNKVLKHHWMEFKESLILPSSFTKKPIICNTDDACCYFNEDLILSDKVNLRFYNAFPNYLTGAGILGTFIGLVAGIYLASQGLVSDDTEKLTESLQNLLNGASLAFWTSIVGILTSILFSWREKSLSHRLNQLINSWNKELDSRIKKITPELIAKNQLGQLKQQTEYLEEFTTNVAFNIAEALNTKLNEKMVPTLERLINSIEGMRKERGDSSESLIKQLVEKFTETMTGAAGSEISALGETINSLNTTLTPLLEKMNTAHNQMQAAAVFISEQIKSTYEKSSSDFSEGMKEVLAELQTGISEAGNSLNEKLNSAFDKSVDKLDDTVIRLDSTIKNVLEAGKSTEKMAESAKLLLNQFNSIANDIGKIQSIVSGDLEALDRTLGSIKSVGDSAVKNLANSVTVLQDLKTAVSEFKSVQQTLQTSWHSYSARFEDVDKSLEKIFQQIDDGLKAYSEATANYMGNLDQHARRVTELFGGAIHDLGEILEDFTDNVT